MIAVLHNIRSLHNVGSVFRTADGAGISKIYLSGITPSPFDRFGAPRPQLQKVSLNAEKFVPWEKVAKIESLLKSFKKQGFQILALEQSHRSANLLKFRLTPKAWKSSVLILGNEVKGLSRFILKIADKILEIPMFGQKESLNVSVAFGIACYGLRPDQPTQI